MRVCILSNSHAASLKAGWDSIKDVHPDYQITFFAVPNRGMLKVCPVKNEDRFISTDSSIREMLSYTSGGAESIEVNNFDAFLVHGMFLILPRLDRRLSGAFKAASIRDAALLSMNYRFVKDLCSMAKGKVFYSANPLLADEHDKVGTSRRYRYHTFEEISDWVDAHYSSLTAIKITQPAETIGDWMTSKRNFSVGSVRLKLHNDKDCHNEADIRHMNAKFGARFLKKSFIPELNKHKKHS